MAMISGRCGVLSSFATSLLVCARFLMNLRNFLGATGSGISSGAASPHYMRSSRPPGQTEIFMTSSDHCHLGGWIFAALALALAVLGASSALAADEPDLIFRRSTVFKLLSPNDKLATDGLDDPEVEGVACHFTVPEKGGYKGWLGLAVEVSDISLACRQIGPIHFKGKLEQGDDMFRRRRSLFFKKMQIVRGCDAKRNVLVYMVYSDRIIEGSPKN